MKPAQHKPLIFRSKEEYQGYNFPSNEPHLLNSIAEQLKELVIIRNPKIPLKGEDEAISSYISEHLGGQNIEECGLWVYYPWINTVVRTLPRDEFIEVRTNRNKYKITEKEYQTLENKAIGVVGLSVGRAVAITAAMERICGEIHLADFDELELSNLNRIRTGLDNLGLNKAISVAREIALIDPFLDVKVFEDGLTENNMDEFFCSGRQLDVLVEACDDLEIKIISRFKARELGIPVVMEASDRCVVDVERFDLEPERPILHNLLGDINIEKLKAIKTDEEKIPILMALNGNEALSPRIRASALEISESINTWPQLASAVSLGGGVLTDVIRRMFISEFSDSGRYYVDVQQLIANKGDKQSDYLIAQTHSAVHGLNLETMKQMAANISVDSSGAFPDRETLEYIVGQAHKAPSGGNSQPWKWLVDGKTLLLFHDRELSDSYLDYRYDASQLSFGASVENLKLAAVEKGWFVDYHRYPSTESELVAHFTFNRSGQMTSTDQKLASAINERTTNRKILMSEEIEDSFYHGLNDVVDSIDGSKLHIYRDYDHKVAVGEMMGSMDRVRVLLKETHADMIKEIRWNKEEAESSKDGIDVATLEMPESVMAGLIMAKDPRVIDLLTKWDKGHALEGLMQYYTMFSDSIGMITQKDQGDGTYFEGGRAVERVWLKANAEGVAFQPIAACIFLFNRFEEEGEEPFGVFGPAVAAAHAEYIKLFKIKEDEKRIFIFRMFKGEEPSVRALRRDLNEHLFYA